MGGTNLDGESVGTRKNDRQSPNCSIQDMQFQTKVETYIYIYIYTNFRSTDIQRPARITNIYIYIYIYIYLYIACCLIICLLFFVWPIA